MKIVQNILALFFLTISFALANDWNAEIMPVKEIESGMIGTSRTVFYGEKIEDFQVEIIQVMHNFYPGMDVILARLLGDQAEKNGVVSGMSGSPVYIDGKLIGAIAYSFGQFMKDPIAGIMPIASMLEIPKQEELRTVEATFRSGARDDYMKAVQTGVDGDFWKRVLRLPQVQSSGNPSLQRISNPLVFSGFQPELVAEFGETFKNLGFTPAFSGSGGGTASGKTTFEPGSAVSVVFISGDLSIEATGTVTAVGDNKLLAFGHQLFNFGPIRLPLAGTQIYATLPSLMSSTKMSTATEVVGTFLQDRMSGAYGDLTVIPTMIPVNLKMESPFHAPTSFSFKLANDPAFNNLLPFYLRIALIQAMNAARLAGEQNSCHIRGDITLSDGRKIELDDFFTSKQIFGFMAAGSDVVSASNLVTVLLGTVMVNDFDAPQVEKIDLELQTIPDAQYAVIESVWQDKTTVKPGDDLTVTIRLRDNNEKISKVTQTVHIPENIPGKRLTVFVSSSTSLTRYEMQVNREKFVPKSFNHLLEIVEKRRKPQNLYVQVRAQDSGLIVEGKEMSDLPPSILGVMNTRASGGVSKRMRDRVIFETALPMQQAILGAKRLSLQIDQPMKATNNNKSRQTWYY
jgi:hypothetical protein